MPDPTPAERIARQAHGDGGTLPLFPDAPEQSADPILTTDERALMPCGTCEGVGEFWEEAWMEGDPVCPVCNGAGSVLRRVGRWRDG